MRDTKAAASPLDSITASLLGGAIGDALGAPVEFQTLETIRTVYGPDGVTDFATPATWAYGRVGAITDDTQMTLFTAEGMLRAHVRQVDRGFSHTPSLVHNAYLRWYHTQGGQSRTGVPAGRAWPDGWLVGDPRLHARRAPGNTCLSALAETTTLGARATNDSKGCGTVMRVAPIGLVFSPERAYELGADVSVLTHGHPTGYIAGGAFAAVIARLMERQSLREAIAQTREQIAPLQDAAETLAAIDAAVALAADGTPPTPQRVESLGGAWIAEEALAIALYCALVATSFEDGVLLAVNHGGDSDSTGSMAGQLLGVMYGLDAIPARWREQVELADLIATLSDDLSALRAGTFDALAHSARYPGY